MADITFEQIKNLVAQMPTDERDRLRDWLNQPWDSVESIHLLRALSDRTYEVWSPQDEGGAIAALNHALQEHQKRTPNAD